MRSVAISGRAASHIARVELSRVAVAEAASTAVGTAVGRITGCCISVVQPGSGAVGGPIRSVGGSILGILGRLALSLPGGETGSEAHVLYFRTGNCLPDPPLRRRSGITNQRTALTDSTPISQHALPSLERMRQPRVTYESC